MGNENTIKQLIFSHLEDKGMFEEQIEIIFSILQEKHPGMNGRWDEGVYAYQKAVLLGLIEHTMSIAKRWIAENEPGAWYRSMFEEAL